MQVVFESRGCFHHYAYEIEFKRAPGLTATIVKIEDEWDKSAKKYIKDKRTALGTVNVSDEEAAGLDRLLDFYRKQKFVACTTVDTISVTLREAKGVIAKESFTDGSGRSDSVEGLTLFRDLEDKALAKPRRKVEKDPELVEKEEAAKANEACRRLAGYEHFSKAFKVVDAQIGSVNMMPDSLFVEIEATRPALINSVWWWNPTSKGKPSLNWDDFLKAYNSAESAMAAHPWLKEWKKMPGERELELHMLGGEIGAKEWEMKNIVMPLWRHAGFQGEPKYCFLGRRGNHAWVEFYFGDREARALVPASSQPDPGASSMIDKVDVSWHPNGKAGDACSYYAVIENDGRCHVEEFVAEPGK